jgi:phosphomevalonate kinase
MIEYAAPGKAVIWGEYAVLEGAPALVMAINRYAVAGVEPADDLWRLTSAGFESAAALTVNELMEIKTSEAEGVAGLIRAVLAALGDPPLPKGAAVHTDTRHFHTQPGGAGEVQKLGIGSSAAICTAACAAIAEFLDRKFDESQPLTAHRLLQGKSGSGLDVAAACRGGVIRFEAGKSSAVDWPQALHYRYFWTGRAAKTTEHLVRFADWRASADTGSLDALCQASERLFADPGLDQLREYVDRLKSMDIEAGLGIFSEAHDRLHALANRSQVVYKPCGAGGGDIGIALSDDPSHLEELIILATRDSFLTLDLEIAAHGVHRIRS